MALPVVKNAFECADFYSTVSPYLPQLRPLPQVVFESITNATALKQIYLDTNPLISALGFTLALAPIFLVVSEINKNYSQVDRCWSILPALYNAHYACYTYSTGLDVTRVAAVALASTLWSMRLTYNYSRRGGYSIGSEDYRWIIVKDAIGPALFFAFNVTFISTLQPILLWLITTPTYVILLVSRLATISSDIPSWDVGDTVAFTTILSLIAISFTADQQQWNFQTAKAQYNKTAKVPPGFDREELELGFATKGLFAYSRHPNFAAEQGVWCTLFLWSCSASHTPYNWTGVGAIAYLILFQASTWLTELLSARKYPEYREYQAQVGRFLPATLQSPKFAGLHDRSGGGTVAKDADAAKARQRYDLR